MWESLSASARILSVGLRAKAVSIPVFKSSKLEMRAWPVNPLRSRESINPTCEHRQFRLLSTTHLQQCATARLTGSTQKAHAIPDAQPARMFRSRFCRERSEDDRLRSPDRRSTLPMFSAD